VMLLEAGETWEFIANFDHAISVHVSTSTFLDI
jgi:hypothetical protein